MLGTCGKPCTLQVLESLSLFQWLSISTDLWILRSSLKSTSAALVLTKQWQECKNFTSSLKRLTFQDWDLLLKRILLKWQFFWTNIFHNSAFIMNSLKMMSATTSLLLMMLFSHTLSNMIRSLLISSASIVCLQRSSITPSTTNWKLHTHIIMLQHQLLWILWFTMHSFLQRRTISTCSTHLTWWKTPPSSKINFSALAMATCTTTYTTGSSPKNSSPLSSVWF